MGASRASGYKLRQKAVPRRTTNGLTMSRRTNCRGTKPASSAPSHNDPLVDKVFKEHPYRFRYPRLLHIRLHPPIQAEAAGTRSRRTSGSSSWATRCSRHGVRAAPLLRPPRQGPAVADGAPQDGHGFEPLPWRAVHVKLGFHAHMRHSQSALGAQVIRKWVRRGAGTRRPRLRGAPPTILGGHQPAAEVSAGHCRGVRQRHGYRLRLQLRSDPKVFRHAHPSRSSWTWPSTTPLRTTILSSRSTTP